MMRWLLFLLLMMPRVAWAQPTLADLEAISPVLTGEWDFEGGKLHFPETAFASLPAAGTSGRIYIVTDAASAGDCSAGGGTSRALCRDTGAAWESIGGAGGGGSGDITDVWTDTSGGVDALTAGAGDTFDAGSADSSKPCVRSATLPGTCAEGDCYQDTDSTGSETYICTATNTWVKLATAAEVPTPVTTITTTPIACATVAGWGLGGLFGAHPEQCASLTTITPAPSTTPTPHTCATVAGYGLGGLYGEDPGLCESLTTITPGPSVTPTDRPTLQPVATFTPPGSCAPGAYQDLPGGTPVCVSLLTPMATLQPLATVTPGGGTPMPVGSATPAAGSGPGYALWDHIHELAQSGVTAATYYYSQLTVDKYGRITSATTLATLVPMVTPTAKVCPTVGIYGGIYGAHPEACVTIGATPTPMRTPPWVAADLPNADDDGTTKGIAAWSNTNFDCTSGVCDLSTNVMTTSSSVQPSQLDRLGGDDAPRTFGNSDDTSLQWKGSLDRFDVTVAKTPAAVATPIVFVNYPSAASSAQILWAWAVNSVQKLIVYGDGSITSTGTYTGDVDTSADSLRIPILAATPNVLPTAAGNCRLNTYTKELTCGDGAVALHINSFVIGAESTIPAGASTTANYAPLMVSAAQNAGTTESNRNDVAPVDLWCDEMRVRTAGDNATGEAVTYTVRDDGADTALTCVIDGDAASSACDGTSTKECCRVSLTAPVLIAQNSLTAMKILCAGANCPSTGLIQWWTLRCWAGQ